MFFLYVYDDENDSSDDDHYYVDSCFIQEISANLKTTPKRQHIKLILNKINKKYMEEEKYNEDSDLKPAKIRR